MIEEIKNTAGVLWKPIAHPRFASEAPGASKDLCGVKGDHKATIREAIGKGEIEEFLGDANAAIPESFDSEENWPQCAKTIGDIRDQSNCGCCWAFGGVEAASDRMCIATNASIMLPLSAQDVCFNAGFHIPGLIGGCSGGQVNTPWSYIKSAGAVTGGQNKGLGPFGAGWCSSFSMPHCHHHGPQGDDPYPAEGKPGCPSQKSPAGPKACDSDAKAPHADFANDKYSFQGSIVSASGEQNIQQAIMAGGPMETAFTVYSDFENYAGGIYHHVSGGMAGGHAVKFVGWGVENGVKYWKVANSWNPHWGEKGYFRIRRGTNEGGIENSAVASSPDAKWSRKGDSMNAPVHPARAAMIEEIKNTAGVLWKPIAHPRFASEAPGASKDLCGVKGDHKATIREAIGKGEIEEFLGDANAAIPESFDSEENWPQCAKTIGDIRDQSNCGCCWAFGGVEAASDRMCIATNASIMLPLSAQDVCFNAGFHIPGLIGGCSGGQVNTPWSYIKSAGAVTGGQNKGLGPFGAGWCSSFSMPHCHHHGPQGDDPYPAEGKPGCPSQKSPAGPKACDSDAKAPHADFANDKYSFQGSIVSASGEQNIQQAIMAGGPMETAFTVYSDFENYAGGIYHHVSGGMAGGHAVKFVGWGVENGVKYWKVANSWNPHWGEKGYFRIRRGTNEGGIENSAVASSPDAKWSKKSSSTDLIV